MDHMGQEQIALHRWAVIAEAAGQQLTVGERGSLVRQIAARAHAHPDGSSRRYSRGTIDRWLRAWRKGGLEALRPSPRADAGTVRAHLELFAEAAALRLELPGRSAAAPAGRSASGPPAWCRYPYSRDVLLCSAIGTPSPNYRTRRTPPVITSLQDNRP